MAIEALGRHLAPEDTAKYLLHHMTEQEAMACDAHIAECEECAAKVRMARLVAEDFGNWLADPALEDVEVGQQKGLSPVLNAFVEAAAANPAWHGILRSWLERWKGRAETVIRVNLKGPEQIGELTTDGLNDLVHPNPKLQFVEATNAAETMRGAPVRTRGGVSGREGVAEIPVSIVFDSGGVLVTLYVNEMPESQRLLELVSTSPGSKPVFAELVHDPVAGRYVAFFDFLPTESFDVRLQPPAE